MTYRPASRHLALDAGALVKIDDARGTTIRVRHGQVWLTQHGDRADHVLDAGTSFAVERNGLTIVQAQEPTVVEIAGPAAARAVVPVAAAPEPDQLARWVRKVSNDWIDRRWAPYL